MVTEIVYLGHDNSIDLLLKADGSAVTLSDVTKITATFGDMTIESTDKASGPITWDQDGYDTGEIRFFLGGHDIEPGIYGVPVVIYNPTHDTGLVWGLVSIHIQAKVEEPQTFLTIFDLKRELGIELTDAGQEARLASLTTVIQDLWDHLTLSLIHI